jgi:DNA mismatch endonuclease (patch repair protein)
LNYLVVTATPDSSGKIVAEKISPQTRSRMMAGIRAKDTQPELLVRSFLHARGFRFRLHRRDLAGRPDLVLPRHQAVVFVHGCFWHGHAGCPYFRIPKTRTKFWEDKIASNSQRDALATRVLHQQGWRVAIVWECALKERPELTLRDVAAFLSSDREHFETGVR